MMERTNPLAGGPNTAGEEMEESDEVKKAKAKIIEIYKNSDRELPKNMNHAAALVASLVKEDWDNIFNEDVKAFFDLCEAGQGETEKNYGPVCAVCRQSTVHRRPLANEQGDHLVCGEICKAALSWFKQNGWPDGFEPGVTR